MSQTARTTPAPQRLVDLRRVGRGGPSVHALAEAHAILERLTGEGIVPECVEAAQHQSIAIFYRQGGDRILSVVTRTGERIDVVI